MFLVICNISPLVTRGMIGTANPTWKTGNDILACMGLIAFVAAHGKVAGCGLIVKSLTTKERQPTRRNAGGML